MLRPTTSNRSRPLLRKVPMTASSFTGSSMASWPRPAMSQTANRALICRWPAWAGPAAPIWPPNSHRFPLIAARSAWPGRPRPIRRTASSSSCSPRPRIWTASIPSSGRSFRAWTWSMQSRRAKRPTTARSPNPITCRKSPFSRDLLRGGPSSRAAPAVMPRAGQPSVTRAWRLRPAVSFTGSANSPAPII